MAWPDSLAAVHAAPERSRCLLATSAGGSNGEATRCARSSTMPATSIPGEDVKIDGVKVGHVSGSVTPTPQAQGGSLC